MEISPELQNILNVNYLILLLTTDYWLLTVQCTAPVSGAPPRAVHCSALQCTPSQLVSQCTRQKDSRKLTETPGAVSSMALSARIPTVTDLKYHNFPEALSFQVLHLFQLATKLVVTFFVLCEVVAFGSTHWWQILTSCFKFKGPDRGGWTVNTPPHPKWSQLVLNGPKWSEMIKNGTNIPKVS